MARARLPAGRRAGQLRAVPPRAEGIPGPHTSSGDRVILVVSTWSWVAGLMQRIVLILGVIAVLSCERVAVGQGAGPSPLIAAVRAADADDDDLDAVLRAALDATADDRSRLVTILRRGTSAQRAAALAALAYAGGDEAIATLQREGHPATDTYRRALLCFALAGRGTRDDRAVLTRELRGEHFGDEWPPIVAAALSLGVLRAADATAALERVANTGDGSGAAAAAGEALRWIRNGPWRIRAAGLGVGRRSRHRRGFPQRHPSHRRRAGVLRRVPRRGLGPRGRSLALSPAPEGGRRADHRLHRPPQRRGDPGAALRRHHFGAEERGRLRLRPGPGGRRMARPRRPVHLGLLTIIGLAVRIG